jgi:hypothetical protein
MYPNYSWREDKNSPFAFFLRIIDTFCHPESGYDIDDLVGWVSQASPPEEVMQFKDDFRRLLAGASDQLPEDALSTAAEYDDGSDEAYLRRLWHELYGDEPIQSGESVS